MTSEYAPDAVPARLVAALGDKYRIERELGAGGSATVYLAEDLKHHRRVAVKVLKPQVAAALGPERFEDEVRIAANLHHPHILAVHDSGEADGFLYYVMPYVDGHSLRDRLAEGLLSFPKVAKVLAEVADALAYAHAQGIVHRDIKPENILYNGKHVVVTDFGIAKAISDAADRKSSTSLGIALGTPAYMAPEQASSDPSLDHRADLYSLGIVGYELLTGNPPFSGSAQQILTSHLTTKPEPIGTQRAAVPPALAGVVMRALAKNPDERWLDAETMQAQLEPLTGTTSNSGLVATVALAAHRRPKRALAIGFAAAAGVVALALFAWNRSRAPGPAPDAASAATATVAAPAATAPADERSIAVLPFENMSSDKEQAYFSDGISEELLNLLAKTPELRVVARTSSFQFRDQDVGIQEIARKLNVAHLLEGSVRKSGEQVRITVQLIRAADGTHLWSETYDRTLDDVFKVQDEIAASVVDKLKLTLLDAPKAPAIDSAVYSDLLRADAIYNSGTPQERERAGKLYAALAARHPDVARAWAGVARDAINQVVGLKVPKQEGLARARDAANKALALDPTLGIAHSYLGSAATIGGDLESAARHYERGLAVSPHDHRVLGNASRLLQHLGRVQDTYRVHRRIAQIDPASAQSHISYCLYAYGAGQLDEAERACRISLELSPDTVYAHSILADILRARGKHAEAVAEATREPERDVRLLARALALDALGQRREAEADMKAFIAEFADTYPSGAADFYAARGDRDRAFEWLEKALAAGDPEMSSVHVNPSLKPLHADPRWMPLLRKAGVAPEQLAKIQFNPKLPD